MRRISFVLIGGLFASTLLAQAPAVTVGGPECLPNEENQALTASVAPEQGGTTVRLYFRRLNPVGGFYYIEMDGAGGGSYWATFPKPEQREQPQLTDEWWDVLKDRDWMEGHDRDWLEDWLDEQDHEAAEYYVAVYDGAGQPVTRSEIMLVQVLDQDDCEHPLTAKQHGFAENLTVGETAEQQAGKQVFHWLCDGIVTRIGANGVVRADEVCRACVVATIPAIPIAATAAGVVLGHEDEPASPTQP